MPDENEKKGFKFPTAYTILFLLIILVAIGTWFIPAGQYDLNEDGEPIPGTYHRVEQNPQRILADGLQAPINGLYGIEDETGFVNVVIWKAVFEEQKMLVKATRETENLQLSVATERADSDIIGQDAGVVAGVGFDGLTAYARHEGRRAGEHTFGRAAARAGPHAAATAASTPRAIAAMNVVGWASSTVIGTEMISV